jgi:hypothetical protein
MNELTPPLNQQNTPQQIVIDSDNGKGVWNNLGRDERKVYSSLIAGLVGLAVAGGVIWLVDRKIKKVRAEKEETKSFGIDKHATWAKQFKLAFLNDGWWGTDVPLVRRTMRAIPSKEDFRKVQASYKALFKGANLIADLSDELTKLEYEEMLAIKNAKPEKAKDASTKVYDPVGWAKRLHAALSYTWLGFLPGTDEDAIKTVFIEIPTQKAFYKTALSYRKMYGTSLWTDLDGDLNWSWDWKKALKKKPKG